jgi:hypothetical protein
VYTHLTGAGGGLDTADLACAARRRVDGDLQPGHHRVRRDVVPFSTTHAPARRSQQIRAALLSCGRTAGPGIATRTADKAAKARTVSTLTIRICHAPVGRGCHLTTAHRHARAGNRTGPARTMPGQPSAATEWNPLRCMRPLRNGFRRGPGSPPAVAQSADRLRPRRGGRLRRLADLPLRRSTSSRAVGRLIRPTPTTTRALSLSMTRPRW